MKTVRVVSPAAPCEIADLASPAIRSNEVRIDVYVSGVNRADILQRKGLYPPPPGESEILGLEASGIVSEVGANVKDFHAGDRVMALLAGGGYAEEVCVPEGLVMRLDRNLSFIEGAAIPEVFLTAHHNLFTLGQILENQVALIHAGASGVGTAAIQLLRKMRCTVFATVGNKEKALACDKLGAKAILYREEDFSKVILDAFSQGIHLILDPVGGPYLERNLSVLRVGGTLVLIALMGGKSTPIDLSTVLKKRLTLRGSTLRGLPLSEKAEVVKRFTPILPLFSNRTLTPVIDTVFPIKDIHQAHQRMEENKNIGKILLQWKT